MLTQAVFFILCTVSQRLSRSIMRVMVLGFLVVIFYCLGSGVFHLVGEGRQPEKLAKVLTWRIGLSFGLFILLFVAYFLGWITPHQLGAVY